MFGNPGNPRLLCSACGASYPSDQARWRCECGGYLRLQGTGIFGQRDLAARPLNIWRYREALGVGTSPVSLGEGLTPLVSGRVRGLPVLLKLDFLCPTGSHKDRGSAVMISKLKQWGLQEIVEDSSGNAGASIAAYAAAAQIRSHIFVPENASSGKLTQVAVYRAKLTKVPGSREDTTRAALDAAQNSFYASHNWSPFFLAGMKTLAYEIAEQLEWQSPDWVVTPVGGGSLLIGLWQGFEEMRTAGLIGNTPRIVGVQSSRCSPVYQAWSARRSDVPAVEKGDTIAEGIAVAQPVKGRDILRSVRDSGGAILTVEDEDIWSALSELGAAGVYVEPTGAVAAAAVRHLRGNGFVTLGQRVVLILTGSGLKSTDKITQHFVGKADGHDSRTSESGRV